MKSWPLPGAALPLLCQVKITSILLGLCRLLHAPGCLSCATHCIGLPSSLLLYLAPLHCDLLKSRLSLTFLPKAQCFTEQVLINTYGIEFVSNSKERDGRKFLLARTAGFRQHHLFKRLRDQKRYHWKKDLFNLGYKSHIYSRGFNSIKTTIHIFQLPNIKQIDLEPQIQVVEYKEQKLSQIHSKK